MQNEREETKSPVTGVWVLVMICVAAIIMTLACGAAYSGIQKARMTAAKASLGQIELAFFLAENNAVNEGFTAPSGSMERILRSYEDASEAGAFVYSTYEKYVLDTMLDVFAPQRDFDFAIRRFQDGTGTHTQVYYFPVKGRTNTQTDLHYVMTDGLVEEKNA